MFPDTKTERRLQPARLPPVGFGITSAALALVGMLLFWAPILGGPISALGLLASLVGLTVWGCGGPESLRWCLRGMGLCLLVLLTTVAMQYARWGYMKFPTAKPPIVPVPTALDVPPPASPLVDALPAARSEAY